MEGLIDWVFRDILTGIGGIDQCSTEFIRVTDRLLTKDIFYKYCPELHTQSRTRSGTPVLIQLLGGQPTPLTENALYAFDLGAFGVDFNFGCPAKTVNRHDGGAALLKTPERIYNILSNVKKHTLKSQKISAKIRLGYDDPSHCVAIAQAIEAAGVETLTVHCRTKMDMYKPPAFWEWIPKIKEKTKLKIIANGEIWSPEDLLQCQKITDCQDFMIGRGVISDPFLFLKIRATLQNNSTNQNMQENILRFAGPISSASSKEYGLTGDYQNTLKLLPKFYEMSTAYRTEHYAVARTKQWLAQLSKKNHLFDKDFQTLKVLINPQAFKDQLLNCSAKSDANPTTQSAYPLQ